MSLGSHEVMGTWFDNSHSLSSAAEVGVSSLNLRPLTIRSPLTLLRAARRAGDEGSRWRGEAREESSAVGDAASGRPAVHTDANATATAHRAAARIESDCEIKCQIRELE